MSASMDGPELVLLSEHEDPSRNDLDTTELVSAARNGDRQAWQRLVVRYQPLVFRVARRYRLTQDDTQDVAQFVWMRLTEHLHRLREPRALPGWIASTTRNEALRLQNARRRLTLVESFDDVSLDRATVSRVDDEFLRQEQRAAVRGGLAELKPMDRELLLLLHAEPRVSFQEISMRLGMPLGSIGPTRARCLEKLRATAAVRSFGEFDFAG